MAWIDEAKRAARDAIGTIGEPLVYLPNGAEPGRAITGHIDPALDKYPELVNVLVAADAREADLLLEEVPALGRGDVLVRATGERLLVDQELFKDKVKTTVVVKELPS